MKNTLLYISIGLAVLAAANCGSSETQPRVAREAASEGASPLPDSSDKAAPPSDTVMPVQKMYAFDIDNRNPKQFGFDGYEVGPINGNGPGSIALLNHYAYIIDGYHGNIKRIDLNDGSMSVVSRNTVEDIITYQGKLYLATGKDSILAVDEDFNVLKSIYMHSAHVHQGPTDHVFIRRPGDPLRLLSSDALWTITNDSVAVDSMGDYSSKRNGINFSVREITANTVDSVKWYAQLGGGHWLQLADSIPAPSPVWYGYNVDADSTRLAYYVLDRKEIKLYVYSTSQSAPSATKQRNKPGNKH